MGIEVTFMTAEHVNTVKELLPHVWKLSWSKDFIDHVFEWRYLRRRCGDTAIVLDDGRCIAILDTFLKTYVIEGERILVREPSDWFCLPEYRHRALGLQVLQLMMGRSEPILSIGGTDMNLAIMKRIGWHSTPDTTDYILPLSTGVAAEGFLRLLKIPAAETLARIAHKVSVRVSRPRRYPPPEQDALVDEYESSQPLPEIMPPDDSYAVASIIDRWIAEWLNAAPKEMGQFLWLIFSVNDVPTGITVSRVYRGRHCLMAKIIHLQTSTVSTELYAWMVAETSKHLAEEGAQAILCQASCPLLGAALQINRFIARGSRPCRWWSKGRKPSDGPVHFTFLWSDTGILPYPS